jgi:hypothetical protein
VSRPANAGCSPRAPRAQPDRGVSDRCGARHGSANTRNAASQLSRRVQNLTPALLLLSAGWGPDDGSDAASVLREGRASPPGRRVRARKLRPRAASAPAPLPVVDYARVARDLARQAAHRAAAEADAEVRGRPHLRADCADMAES